MTLPELGGMPANVAGILPLAALIDFTDPQQLLHFYQLSGRGMMWNWVITPACARLILSLDGTGPCCLDEGSAVPPLFCLDGCWGDLYHCSSPSTIRACMGVAAPAKIKIDPPPREWGRVRPQRLRIILVLRAESKSLLRAKIWYTVITYIALCVLLIVMVITMVNGLYIALLYLGVVVLTGSVIHISHGFDARLITEEMTPLFSRLVVVADNFNEDKWTTFIGPNLLLTPLLNKPLKPNKVSLIKPLTKYNPFKHLRTPQFHWPLFILVAVQWVLTIIASGCQDWDALVIFAWIALCALTSSFLYSKHSSAKSWLESNGLQLKKVDVELSFRMSMLSLLVALNPDTVRSEQGRKWIDPILAPTDKDRIEWEKALLECLQKDEWDEKIRACYDDSGLLFHPCC